MTDGPVHEEKRAQVAKLVAEGVSRNQIAKDLGIGAATVSRIAKAEGLSFDRSMTRAAVEARSVDLADSRTKLAEKMLNTAHGLIDSLDEPFLVFNFGGRDNEYNEHRLDKPPVDAYRQVMTTAGIAFDKATKILEKSKPGAENVAGMIGLLAASFTKAAEDLDNEFDSPTVE